MIGKADTADILAGRYVDGTWSYTQALYEAKKRGVSKEEFDAEVFAWRGARDSGDRMTTYEFVDKIGDAKCSRKHMTFS